MLYWSSEFIDPVKKGMQFNQLVLKDESKVGTGYTVLAMQFNQLVLKDE